jgi:hypothetical protein
MFKPLVFRPKAVFDDVKVNDDRKIDFMPLQSGFAKIKVSGRVTGDDGRSLVATEGAIDGPWLPSILQRPFYEEDLSQKRL